MSGSPFRSFRSAPVKVAFTKDDVVRVARQLLEEHALAREAATRQANSVCGNCTGAGEVASILMPELMAKCWACEGTGKPNDKMVALPELTAEDNHRLWKLNRLLTGYPESRVELLAVIREYFPEMYRDDDKPAK